MINEKTEMWTVILRDSQYFRNKALKDYIHLHCIVYVNKCKELGTLNRTNRQPTHKRLRILKRP